MYKIKFVIFRICSVHVKGLFYKQLCRLVRPNTTQEYFFTKIFNTFFYDSTKYLRFSFSSKIIHATKSKFSKLISLVYNIYLPKDKNSVFETSVILF